MKLQLPILQLSLPEWQDKDFVRIKNLINKVRQIGATAGGSSDHFKEASRRLKLAFARETHPAIASIIRTKVDVRAFTALLASDHQFAEEVLIDKSMLNHLLSINSPLSKLSLIQLIRTYFTYFDRIAEGDDLSDWSYFINRQLAAQDLKNGSSELRAYAENAELLFSKLGPSKVAAKAESEQVDLDVLINRLGLSGYADGRFLTLTRYQYYLQRLEKMPVGAEDELLAELMKPEVYNAPHENNQLLGHVILKTMIDRSSGQQLSDAWQRVILSIAGDPRVPKSSPKYQKWWSLLGEKRLSLVRGWLSRFDLSLFLKVLEQSARDGRNEDMERMFKPRKAFMDGLEEAEVITGTRLFLSKHAENYLKQHYRDGELPNYAVVASPHTSMIYLNIMDKVHMVEGSHSFTLKLMKALPGDCNVIDYDVSVIGDHELRKTISKQYRKQYGDDGIVELTHNSEFGWQARAIEFLKAMGVRIRASQVIEGDKYRAYKRKYGAD